MKLYRRDLADNDVERVAGLRRTTALRTVLDCCRALPLNEAVAAADSALRHGAVTVAQLEAAADAVPRGPGRSRVRRALSLVDPAAGSVLESCFRVLMHEHGLAPDNTQLTLRLPDGRRIVRADFVWRHCRLVVETDGFETHSSASAQRHDAWVHNRLAVAGWRCLRFTWFDVMHRPDEVADLVRTMLGSCCPRWQALGPFAPVGRAGSSTTRASRAWRGRRTQH